MAFVNICHKWANGDSECTVINILLTKECAAFSKVSAFGVHTDRFQNAQFSNLFVFISVFEKLRFHSGAMWTQGNSGEVLLRSNKKTEQCERVLNLT